MVSPKSISTMAKPISLPSRRLFGRWVTKPRSRPDENVTDVRLVKNTQYAVMLGQCTSAARRCCDVPDALMVSRWDRTVMTAASVRIAKHHAFSPHTLCPGGIAPDRRTASAAGFWIAVMMLSRVIPAGASKRSLIWVGDAATVSIVHPGAEQASVTACSQNRAVAGIFSNALLLCKAQMTWYHCSRLG